LLKDKPAVNPAIDFKNVLLSVIFLIFYYSLLYTSNTENCLNFPVFFLSIKLNEYFFAGTVDLFSLI